jgi:hypothetical protein
MFYRALGYMDTHRECGSRLRVDAMFCFEGFADEEWPCLIDTLREELALE